MIEITYWRKMCCFSLDQIHTQGRSMALRPMRVAHPMSSRKQLSPHHVAEVGKEHCIFIVIVIVWVNM